jgi:hypothetical protein
MEDATESAGKNLGYRFADILKGKPVSRRTFLRTAGPVIGLGAAAAGLAGLTGCAPSSTEAAGVEDPTVTEAKKKYRMGELVYVYPGKIAVKGVNIRTSTNALTWKNSDGTIVRHEYSEIILVKPIIEIGGSAEPLDPGRHDPWLTFVDSDGIIRYINMSSTTLKAATVHFYDETGGEVDKENWFQQKQLGEISGYFPPQGGQLTGLNYQKIRDPELKFTTPEPASSYKGQIKDTDRTGEFIQDSASMVR